MYETISLPKKPGYTLFNILKQNRFYSNLSKSAELITDDVYESSFTVHGLEDYVLNKPIKEFDGEASAHIVPGTGVSTIQEECGLHVPEGRIPLINVHFHPLDDIAAPSEKDLESQYRHSQTPVNLAGASYLALGAELIGLRTEEGITLFCSQLNAQNAFSESLASQLTEEIDAIIKKVPDSDVPYEVAELLNSTGQYVADVLTFSNQDQYKEEVKRLEVFQTFDNEPVIDDDELADDECPDYETQEERENKIINGDFDDF